jgi:hypothetical protein
MPDFFADSLVNQHVAVDRNTDRKNDAGNAGQCQGCAEKREQAEDHRYINANCNIGD